MSSKPHRQPSLALTALAALLVAALGAFAGSAGWAALRCPTGSACAKRGLCTLRIFPWPGCVATSAACAASEECRDFARCTRVGGVCEAKSDADCAKLCESDGFCKLTELDGGQYHRCVLTPEGCRQSLACRERGECAPGTLLCQPASDEDCRKTIGCALRGACSYHEGQCQPAKDEDCARSDVCRVLDACSVSKGKWRECTLPGLGPPDSSRRSPCAERETCSLWGRCAGPEHACEPATDAHCRASLWCSFYGQCTLGPASESGGRECVGGSHHDCRASEGCKRAGACWLTKAGVCAVLSDADCAASQACKNEKRCIARDGACVSGCAESAACREEGRCTNLGGSCVASSSSACAGTPACLEEGRCSEIGGKCRVVQDDDCQRSSGCKVHGKCDARSGGCKAAILAQCLQSEACKREGRCSLSDGECIAKTARDCAQSEACKRWGRCTVNEAGACAAMSSDDCRSAETCKKHQRCKAIGGDCWL